MTFSFKPLQLIWGQATATQQFRHNKAQDHSCLQVSIGAQNQDSQFPFDFDQENIQVTSKYVYLQPSNRYRIELSWKVGEEINKRHVDFNIADLIKKANPIRNKLMQDTIKINQYQLLFAWKYDKFVNRCGTASQFIPVVHKNFPQWQESTRRILNTAEKNQSDKKDIREFPQNKKRDDRQSSLSKINQSNIKGSELSNQKANQFQSQKNKSNIPEVNNRLVLKNKDPSLPVVDNKLVSKVQDSNHPEVNGSLVPKKKKKIVLFYKGACPTRNFFSCIDPGEIKQQQQFTIVQDKYRNEYE